MDFTKRNSVLLVTLLASAFCMPLLHAEDRGIDPTFLYRNASSRASSIIPRLIKMYPPGIAKELISR